MIGKLIGGKYRIDSVIGSGGMANVYKAHDIENDRTVALKILKEEFWEDSEFIRRFEREAKSVLSLSHENIVRSFDVGEDGGAHYIVLEYISGTTLKEYIKRNGPLSQRTAVGILSQILDALDHAHMNGIIHRDIKPQNVLLTHKGVAKLTDFGIARDSAASTKTFTGSNVMGSVHYISPEQAKGDSVTERSDIYSAGIMLYEMLTGTVPFDAENSVSVALKHISDEVLPPAELNPKISPAMNDVILKAVAKNPMARYATAGDFRSDLLRALREPNGRFAGNVGAQGGSKKDEDASHTWIKRILLALGITLGAFLIIFIISTIIYSSSRSAPALLGKTLAEASEIASEYSVEVAGWVESTEYPSGLVAKQKPDAGASIAEGATISVYLSSGSDNITLPKLIGYNLTQATDEILKLGLRVEVVYEQSTEHEKGKVFKQSPEEGENAKRGDTVTITICGSQAQTALMPSLVGMQIKSAAEKLVARGFENIRVRYSTTEGTGENGCIVKQSLNAGMELPRTDQIELVVYGTNNGAYIVDKAYNVTIDTADSKVVVVTVSPGGYELEQYESILPVGTHAVSFTAHMDTEGEYEVIVYVNGSEYKRDKVKFAG